MKILLILIFLVNYFHIFSTELIEIECEKINVDFINLKSIPTCELREIKPKLSNKSDEIVKCLVSSSDCVDLFAFQAQKMDIPHIPKGLSTIFHNLTVISIVDCGLNEIHREDLRNFTELLEIHLHGNKIEFLEANLFEFNLKLEVKNLFS